MSIGNDIGQEDLQGNGVDDNMMNDMGGDNPNQFDTNFDAGVEADEDSDPKKYIQQLTGKLSQSLRSYNENLPQPDADLNKYVAGMIVKQAVEGLSPDDTNEIINKINNDDSDDETSQTDNMDNVDNFDQDMNMGESKVISNKDKIDEIFNQIIKPEDEKQMQKPINNIGYKKKPFTSPHFK